ncbi:hypothetical protein JKP88DRAFT_352225 [Tribonema minus]|uniref:Uncharacterized protein n=1 Tax=Tribonema minus TaxID=303371 RepID=A0A835ZEY4_9STRA|nr:hypothetical protein JKP88DRAFT_352225 [Tribonema minus]
MIHIIGFVQRKAAPATRSLPAAAVMMQQRCFQPRARLVAYGLDYGKSDVQPAIPPPAVETVKGESPPAEARRDKWAHALAAPEKGCLLLARDGMFGESQKYFKNAVILVIEHGATGSVGLILNQPTVRSMGEVTGGDSGLAHLPGLERNRLYFGGDVGKRRDDGLDVVNFMHGRDDCEGIEVIKGVKLGGLPDALALVAQGKADPSEFKFFVRFCGWGPGQLAREVKLGAWYAAACDVGTVLDQYTDESQPAALWTEVLARMGGKYKTLAENGRLGARHNAVGVWGWLSVLCALLRWGPGQLARKVKLGAWSAAACDMGTVLNQYTDESQPAALWTEVLARMGGKYKALAEMWGGHR